MFTPTPNHHSNLWLYMTETSIGCNDYVRVGGGGGGDVGGKLLINVILDAINLSILSMWDKVLV